LTIGTGTFIPHAKFAVPRSYVYLIDIPSYGYTFSSTGPTWFLHAPFPDLTFATMVVDNDFWVWNSNGRTLDHILTELWYKLNGVGAEIPLDYTLGYRVNALHKLPSLYLDWAGIARLEHYFPTPPQPPSYWLPKPLT
jgi:hypothetical protein